MVSIGHFLLSFLEFVNKYVVFLDHILYTTYMPRKSKVTAVPIEQPKEVEQVSDEKTDAEQMTEIVKVIDDPPVDPVVEPAVEQAVKPKAKRAPRAKKEPLVVEPVVEPIVDVTNTIDESVINVDLNNIPEVKVEKENSKVECPDCGKRMSAKTLRYSHIPNCLFKKQADKEEALIKESEGKCVMTISDEVIEAEVKESDAKF